jgi:hypothetical protein
VVKEVRIGPGKITIRHSIPSTSPDPPWVTYCDTVVHITETCGDPPPCGAVAALCCCTVPYAVGQMIVIVEGADLSASPRWPSVCPLIMAGRSSSFAGICWMIPW